MQSIDWSEFLGRHDIPLSPDDRDHLRGQRVLITGAAGSIGSALTSAVSRCGPSELIAVDHSELGLYELGRDLRSSAAATRVHLALGSVTDHTFVHDLFRRSQPAIVFHAAALKHVPLLEENAYAAATTNALGTEVIVHAAHTHGVARCSLLSTDKAVDPTSIMGATKRIAECLFLSTPGPAKRTVLRLGNVLGSSGSVVPLFLDQIRRGEPVTVADRQATRFFLTLPEAVTLLIKTATTGGPDGLFIPAVCDAHRILDLAHFLIARHPEHAEKATVTLCGLRAGDKLGERMTGAGERVGSPHPETSLQHIETPLPARGDIDRCLRAMEDAVRDRDLAQLLEAIEVLVPNYQPSDRILSQLATPQVAGPA